ncbi:transcriptional regulator, TetR family [Gracilibacillus ureilyticus]|uniref:Transcriptional regulator, TetR family n=1 Tax=Gracilibacillus ureilyticus TaxID=531814 RepID=A0A1H9Q680_9BACI|nr:TetR/AcrR family transcriptional regulator [Gracilibacillus ureilyticus]SER55625.1 transcriptional regulator, TetR family [Gracilibacillus ureilyticus]
MRKSREETELTVQKLKEIAKFHFIEKGYAQVALEDIVKDANLTRGALYHHFKNKQALFLAVFESIQRDVAEYVEAEAGKSDDLWEQLINGCRAFLTAATEANNVKILLIDGPSVLGWGVFREMDEKYSMNSLREQLIYLQENNQLKEISIDAVTHSLSGAMNEAALWIAEQRDRQKRIGEAVDTIILLLEGVKNETT